PCNLLTATGPSLAATISCPSRASVAASESRIISWSSTTSILAMMFLAFLRPRSSASTLEDETIRPSGSDEFPSLLSQIVQRILQTERAHRRGVENCMWLTPERRDRVRLVLF